MHGMLCWAACCFRSFCRGEIGVSFLFRWVMVWCRYGNGRGRGERIREKETKWTAIEKSQAARGCFLLLVCLLASFRSFFVLLVTLSHTRVGVVVVLGSVLLGLRSFQSGCVCRSFSLLVVPPPAFACAVGGFLGGLVWFGLVGVTFLRACVSRLLSLAFPSRPSLRPFPRSCTRSVSLLYIFYTISLLLLCCCCCCCLSLLFGG